MADDCTKVDCVVKVFDIIASLYVNTYRYTYSQIHNGLDSLTTIDDTVIGCGLADAYDLETFVADICFIYQIQRTFEENKLTLYRNNNLIEDLTPVAIISAAELAVSDTGASADYEIATTYNGTTNAVTQVAFNFLDADNDYKPNQLTAKRPDAIQTDPVRQVSLPFVMHLSQAEKLVNRLLGDARLGFITHAFRLPPKYGFVGKGDVLQINHGTFSDTVRVVNIDFNADKSQSVSAETVGTRTIEIDTPPHASTVNRIGGPVVDSVGIVLDIPLVRPVDNYGAGAFEMHMTVTPSKQGPWLGGYIARKFAGDENIYETLFYNYGQPSNPDSIVMRCRATNALTDKRWVTDSDTLSLGAFTRPWNPANNKTKAQIDANPLANVAVYGAPGRWEIIQFESIVNGIMSGIVRGLRGSENACKGHAANDYVIPLAPGMTIIRYPANKLGNVVSYRTISEGQQFISGTSFEEPGLAGNARKPFAPYHFTASRDGGGNITIEWLRRDRLGTGWGHALPNSEGLLAFAVDVCAPGGAVLRTLAATAANVVYTAEAQSADGVSGAATFLIKAKQIGDIGAGFEGTGTINV